MPHLASASSPRRFHRSRRQRFAVTAALVLGAMSVSAVGADPASGAAPVQPAGATVSMFGLRVDAGDPARVAEALAVDGFDVVGRERQTIFVLGPPATGEALGDVPATTIVSVDPAAPTTVPAAPADQDDILPRRLHGTSYETFYGGYRTVDAYLEFTDDLEAAYPDLVQSIKYGESWDGDELRAVCVTADAGTGCQRDPDVDKARFLVVAQTHARELSTSELMWRYVTYLVDGYGRSARVTGLLDGTEVWVVPQVNPDGIEVTQQGIIDQGTGSSSPAWQRKNVNDSYSSPPCGGPPPSSHEGVDLNRNFDIDWGRTGTSTNPCSLVYGGPRAASEPETTAQVALMQDLFRDQRAPGMGAAAPRGTTGSMLTLHSYSDVVLLPWGFTGVLAPNDAGLRSYAFRMSHFNGYQTGTSDEILYISSGATEDWAYSDLGVAGYTFEIGPGGGACGGFFPAYSCQDGFWQLNKDAFMYGAEGARQPYALPFGPTTTHAKARPKGGRLVVSATTDDSAYGTGVDRPDVQDIAAGRIFIGTAPWAGGSAVPMTVKGSGASAKIRTKVPAPPRRTIAFVQGRDASGEWGPVAPVWLDRR